MARLPRPPTSLIGREVEIAEVLAHLAGGARLVTLTGIGGIGKTRLALAVGARLEEGGAAVAYCDVVSIHSLPELVVVLADALDVDLAELAKGRPLEALMRALGGLGPSRVVTLIVDNFEHLAAQQADVLDACLAAAPRLRMIVTSRVSLVRTAELVFAVSPLSAEGLEAPAVALLAARARMSPGWQEPTALVRLAARLDGLPLALELAAARAHLVTPDQLVAVLEEDVSLTLPQQSPRRASRDAAVAWSWDQLEPAQRSVLKRLALPEGSFDFELAVAMAGLSRAETLAALGELARYGMLHPETGAGAIRHRVLETVRDYVAAQTSDAERLAGWDAIGKALLARVEPHVSSFSRELPAPLAAGVRADRDLYLAVMRRGLESERAATIAQALRVAAFLVPLFLRSGSGRLATDWTATILERPETQAVPLALRLGAAVSLVVASVGGDNAAIVDRVVARVHEWMDATPESQLAMSAVGVVHHYRWEHRALLTLADTMLASKAAAKNPDLAGYATAARATARRALGLSDESDDAALAQVLARFTSPNHVTTECLVSLARAHLAIQHGRGDALELAERGVERSRQAGFRWFEALFLLERGRAHHDGARLVAAHEDVAAAAALFDAKTAARERAEATLDLTLLALEQGRHEEARGHLVAAAGTFETAFERAYAAALWLALAALTGDEAPAPRAVGWGGGEAPRTSSVEDAAFAALSSLGRAAPAVDVEAARGRAFRFRRVWPIHGACQKLANGEEGGGFLAMALDENAVRVGKEWIDLSAKPLLCALARSLVRAHHAGEAALGREALGAVLWPDERLKPDVRDQRLHTAVSALRREALGALVESLDGGYRLTPELTVLHLAPAVWPGASGRFEKARGRGRPRRAP